MAERITWGLDMSTSKVKTAAVALEWRSDGARLVAVHHPLAPGDIAPLIGKNADSWWAIDVPFGWPDAFVELMAWRHNAALAPDCVPDEASWERWRTRTVAQRRTDEFLTHDPRIRTRPLPASFQLLGATAAMWTLIESRLAERGVVVDRAGIDGRVCETYPRAVLAAWGIRDVGKLDWARLQHYFPFLTTEPDVVAALATEDVCDAVVCAMAARARSIGVTLTPREEIELAAARREGWIHVSVADPRVLLR